MYPRKWFFKPRVFLPETISDLEDEWINVPDPKARKIVAVREHYWRFHLFQLESLRSVGIDAVGTTGRKADLCLRAGLIHTGMVLCASMAEMVLLAHYEIRGLIREPKTFGKILEKWKIQRTSNGKKKPYVRLAPIWVDLNNLKKWRNDVHLYRLLKRWESWNTILKTEEEFKGTAERVLCHLKNFHTH